MDENLQRVLDNLPFCLADQENNINDETAQREVDEEVAAFLTGAVPDQSPIVITTANDQFNGEEFAGLDDTIDRPFSLQAESIDEQSIRREVEQHAMEAQDPQINKDLNQIQTKAKLTAQERGKLLQNINRRRKQLNTKRRSTSDKAGVLFPVNKVIKTIKKIYPQKRVSTETGVYLAAVLEYLTSEMLDLAGAVAYQMKKKRIIPRYIQLAINGDDELKKLLEHVTIIQGGVTPYVHPELLQTRSSYARQRKTQQADKQLESQERESAEKENEPLTESRLSKKRPVQTKESKKQPAKKRQRGQSEASFTEKASGQEREEDEVEEREEEQQQVIQEFNMPPTPETTIQSETEAEENNAPNKDTERMPERAERQIEPIQEIYVIPIYLKQKEKSGEEQIEGANEAGKQKRAEEQPKREKKRQEKAEKSYESENEEPSEENENNDDEQERESEKDKRKEQEENGQEEEEEEEDDEEEGETESSDEEDAGDYSESDEKKQSKQTSSKSKTEKETKSKTKAKEYEQDFGSESDESEFMRRRSPFEKKVIHKYYQEIGHKGGRHRAYSPEPDTERERYVHPGYMHETRSNREQDIIHKFLSEIGRKGGSHSAGGGGRRRTRPTRSRSLSADSGFMRSLSKEDRDIVHRYYQEIGHKGGRHRGFSPEPDKEEERKVHRGFMREEFSPHEQDVIHRFLSHLGQGRKFRDRDYNRGDLKRARLRDYESETSENEEDISSPKRQRDLREKYESEEREREKKASDSKRTPQASTPARLTRAGKATPTKTEKVPPSRKRTKLKEMEKEEQEVAEETTPKKRGRPSKKEQKEAEEKRATPSKKAATPQKQRKSKTIERKKGDVDIEAAFKQSQQRQQKKKSTDSSEKLQPSQTVEDSNENKENANGAEKNVEMSGQEAKRTPLKQKPQNQEMTAQSGIVEQQRKLEKEIEDLAKRKRDTREQVFGKSVLETSPKKYHLGSVQQQQQQAHEASKQSEQRER